MATLRLQIEARLADEKKTLSALQLLVTYSRVIRQGAVDANGTHIPDEAGLATRQFTLSENLTASISIEDYVTGTSVTLAITDSQGGKLLEIGEKKPTENNGSNEWTLKQTVSREEAERLVEASTPLKPIKTRAMSAKAEFKPTVDRDIHYKNYSLVVSTIDRTTISDSNLSKYSLEPTGTTSAVLHVGPNALLSDLKVAAVNSVSLSLQGQFEFTIPKEANDNAWVWVLSGAQSFTGVVDYNEDGAAMRRVLWLPFSDDEIAEAEESTARAAIPIDPSEQELLNNPELFTDDPGTKCKPFSSPHRIVGERTFQTVLRVTQPEISRDEAAPKPPRPLDISRFYNIDSSNFMVATATGAGTGGTPTRQPAGGPPHTLNRYSLVADAAALNNAVTTVAGGRPAGTTLSPEEEILAEVRADVLRQPQGRRVLGNDKSLDWEDNTPVQAASLSYGHILEYRVRWRNNGYSLGDVLYSLPLAPRQTKQIITVSSTVVDRARRVESTTASEEIAQGTTREYGYTDAVEAGLSEWSKGGSKSRQTGAAGGFGMTIGPVVLGGGASHGQATSSSWQEGGRAVSAREQQSLNDAIRQYGESVRKLETVVIQEQSQEETTQAISEVVRNPNYCHTLTIVYHEILRHLRVDTEVVGARECVFVPLPIRPFILTRMIRWRDSLTQVLMRPSLQWVMPYLEDVRDNFANSDIPDGSRAAQPITFLVGSVYLRLAVERPSDSEDEDIYDQARWLALSPFVNRPVREIFERLKRNIVQKDQIFQRDYAPGIAARWVDRLRLAVNGLALNGVDFTLAGTYRYGRSVRVDFTCSPDRALTRNDLVKIVVGVEEDADLTPGSIANLQRLSIRYTTKDFSREKSSDRAARDLIKLDTGHVDPDGAETNIPLDDWEKKNQRAIIKAQTDVLKRHLNEHLEHYHKHLWWNLDRDKLYMLLDTIYAVSEEDGRSVASVVERNPIAILGNNLVYRVAGGAHLGIDGHRSTQDLNDYYTDSVTRGEPIRISLPTAGVYAQALLDDCEACEEHFGSTEWILDDKEQELAGLDPSMLSSRRVSVPDLTPSQMPASIINLQNAPNVPAPSGLSGVLNSVASAESFKDMAGLAGTQANSQAAMNSAAQLATHFGTQAADIRKKEIAAKVAKEQLDVVRKAVDKGLVPADEAKARTQQILDNMAPSEAAPPMPALQMLSDKLPGLKKASFSTTTKDGVQSFSLEGGIVTGDGDNPTDATGREPTIEEWAEYAGTVENEEGDEDFGPGVIVRSDHGGEVGRSTQVDTSGLLQFGSAEHASAAQWTQTDLIDYWARNGLIDGGAFIDKKTDSSGVADTITNWTIVTPERQSNAATNPYPTLSANSRAHWHYVIPDANGPGGQIFWTEQSLRQALLVGEAAALSVGEIIMLAGDMYGTFDELVGKSIQGTSPRPSTSIMTGYASDEPWAHGILSLRAYERFSKSEAYYPGRFMRIVANKQQEQGLAQINFLETLSNPLGAVVIETEIKSGSQPRWRNTRQAVQYLRSAVGPTKYSEVHVLARLLQKDGTITIDDVSKTSPWTNSSLKPTNLKRVSRQLIEIVMTNGKYFELALDNKIHFAPDNLSEFKKYQQMAFTTIANHVSAAQSLHPIPADAIAQTAFGLHFLTDAYSAGHMRVPRAQMGNSASFAAGIMHDFDGEIGLTVKNQFGHVWRAFGDGNLSTFDSKQMESVARLSAAQLPAGLQTNPSAAANEVKMWQTVNSAFKQLGYEAEKGVRSLGVSTFDDTSEHNRKAGGDGFVWDEAGSGTALNGGFPDRLNSTEAEKLTYIEKLFPTPMGVGPAAWENHPPLAIGTGTTTWEIPSSTNYRRNEPSSGRRRELMLRWQGTSYIHDYSDFFQLEKNVRNRVPNWLGFLPDGVNTIEGRVPKL